MSTQGGVLRTTSETAQRDKEQRYLEICSGEAHKFKQLISNQS